MAQFTREDFMRDAMARYSSAAKPDPKQDEQGIIMDGIDMFQRGLGQTLGGDLETVGQIADSQGLKDAGRGVSAWADGQLQEVSTPMREAMGKQFFQENAETGAIEAGDAWADPRAWAGNFATVLGQFTGLVGGTKGAGVLAKPVLRGAGKLLAKDLVEGQARELVAKATVKDAIQAGALDSVRAAYLAAPSEAAKRAVLDKAIGRLTSIGYGAHAGAMASGMRAQQAEQEARGFLNGLGNDELNANPIYQQAYWDLADGEMQGASVGDIRRAAIDSIAEKAATDAWSDPRALSADFLSGMLTGAGGGVGGVLGKVGTTRAGAAARGFVGEGATEAWQGGETQRAVNQAVQEWADETRDPMAGVLSSALNEGTLGGAFGGVVGGVRGPEAQAASKPVVRVERRVVTGDEQMDDMIHGLDQRQAERGASIDSQIESMFAGENNPLGSGKFDPIRDVPAYERQGFVRGSHDFKGRPIIPLEGELMDPGTGVATNATEQDAGVVERPSQSAGMAPAIEDLSLSGELMSDGSLPPPQGGLLPGATIDGVASEVGTELPAPTAAQIGQEQPTATPTQYNSLRLTRRGLPFSSEKEAALASRQDETPVPLDGGGFGIAKIADVTQPQAEAFNEQAPQVLAVGSEGQGDQLGAGEPAATGAESAIAGLADRAGFGDPADYAAAPLVPDGQQQDDQTLTAPATDAGVAVSEVVQPEPVAPEPAAVPTPWAEAIDNPDGTITLKGEVPLIKQWAKDSGVKAIPGKGGMVVAKSSAAKVREYVAPAASEPVQQIEADAVPASNVRLSQQRKGLSVEDAGKVVDDFLRDYNGNIPVEPFIREKASEIYGPSVEGTEFARTTKGAYHPSAGLVTIISGNAGGNGSSLLSSSASIRDIPVRKPESTGAGVSTGAVGEQKGEQGGSRGGKSSREHATGRVGKGEGGAREAQTGRVGAKEDLIKTLRHELLGHYGTDTFTPENKRSLLQKLIDAKQQPWLAKEWSAANKGYKHLDEMGKAEEVFASIAEKELPPRTIQTWNDIKTEFARLLRKAGLVKGPIKEHELDSLIRAVGKGIRNGDRTKQNIRGDQEVIGKQADEPAKDDKPERIISFSKQAMSQGEKPAKHLTRKEAELVTKEWFKQYRGASGIDVQIHATQAELEQALGLAAKEGLIRRAAFDDDNGTLHVAADTIANPKRMREILRHEVLAHYGLANVLGDGEYTKLISRLIKSRNDPSMKAVWDWVDTHYADEELGVQAEEVVAHLAELEQSAWRRGWDQVVAWVTKALRTVGFVPGGITAAETRVLIEGLGKKMKRGGPDNGGPDGGQKFSQEDGRTSQYKNPLGTTQGLQLPKRGSPERVSDSNVLTKDDIRKGGLKMSQSNTAADDSKTLEQSIKQKAVYQAGAALSSVKNWLKQGRPLMLGTLTDLQIDQVYRDITGGAVSQYQRLRTQMEADRNDILLDAETRIDPLWDALGKQEKADLSNLMHDATMARLHPDKSLDENSYYQEAKQKLERAKKPETRAAYEAELRTIELNHSALAKQYNALPANAKALYGTMLDTYTKQWESLRGAIEQRLEDLLGVSEGRAMAAGMRQKMEHALQHGPYFPLTRYGDYVIKASKGDEYVREHFERRADAEQAVKQYQRDGYNAVMTVKEEGSGDSANANQLGMEMLNFLDNADGVSKTALKDEIWQAMLRMMPDASYAKHAIHRRRVKGASRDAHRAYLNSVYHYARHVSKIRYGHKMQGELDKLSEQIRAGVAGEPSSLKPDDLEIAQQVLNEMNKRHDLNMNPTGKAWAGAAGNIGFLYYIGPSLASAVVNMTQNFTVMLPQLGAKYGFAKSASAMTEALRDYWRHGKFKAGTTEAWRSLTRSTTLPADERAMLERLYRSGVLDLTQAHSIAAKADTDQQDAKPMSKGWRRAMRWAGATFHNAEVLNREVAALAAYRLLKQAEPTLDGQQYADRVAEMVYDGHGNYAASNRPRYMRNDITKVLTQFKIYSQMMTYVLYSNAIKAAKGDRVAAKTLAGVLATHWVMAGVMGLPTPIAAVAYALAAAFDDDDDRSGEASFRLALTEALGPRAGELLAKGPMDAITNLSIAGRTGLGDLWWRSPKEGTEGDDLAWHAVQQLLGPVAGIGINMARGAGQMTDGHIQRGMETVLPKSIRDAAKALRQVTEGEQTIKGDVIMDDVSAWNVAMQAIGFGSAQMAKNYDAREYIKGKERRIADKRSELMADYYNARKSGDMDAVQEVLDHIKMFNATHNPGERITGKSLALSFKSKLRSNERTQGGIHLNRNREYLREEGKFAEQ
ncbi:PLxRFG domain-containing protein [Aeromonas veronii]|uniref:PLxRFG domain-containing protein n=1 Tax=Aeromonas veronii TaxID=654 RepID=UPI002246E39E|nr:PLxRFG domain-containing protein [Aeromonas veronii]MCX0443401.1 PLxRFG domain-containing protein [Aeromonas veronii]